MTRGMVKGARGRVAAVAMCLLLAAGGLAALPAVPAGASTTVVAVFSGDGGDYATPLCSLPGTYHYGGKALEVFNPCSDRVWVHYISGSTVQEYCVNPGGGLAYDLPINWAGGDISDLQITTNKSPCDAGDLFGLDWCASTATCPLPIPDPPPPCIDFCQGAAVAELTASLAPDAPDDPIIGGYSCQASAVPYIWTGHWVYQVWNAGCDFRIWLHQHDDGSGLSLCLNPGQDTPGYSPAVYWQVQETNNQAPCDAGGPPYPY